MEIIEKVNKLL